MAWVGVVVVLCLVCFGWCVCGCHGEGCRFEVCFGLVLRLILVLRLSWLVGFVGCLGCLVVCAYG